LLLLGVSRTFPSMVTIQDIRQAQARIADAIFLSPLARSESLSRQAGAPVYLKLENLQMTGSFKERGALNRLLSLSEEERAGGVIASSAGNHAQAVAYIARRLDIRATIVMPETAPLTKVSNTRGYGAEVVLSGETYADAFATACRIQQDRGLHFIHPYDDELVIAGQGTIGLELLQQEPEIEVVVLPVGGGGLIAGVRTAVKSLAPDVEIVGVEASAYPSAQRSLAAGRIEACGDASTLADGIAVRSIGDLPFALMQRVVDRVVTVTEEEIASSILALAAVLERHIELRGRRVACLVSGGNIDVNTLAKIIERGLTRDGRRVRLSVDVPDRPGSLSRVAEVVAACRANVLEVHHERAFSAGPVGTTAVRFTLETRGRDHVEEVTARLEKEGFRACRETSQGCWWSVPMSPAPVKPRSADRRSTSTARVARPDHNAAP
jgi:threonine dehydratase